MVQVAYWNGVHVKFDRFPNCHPSCGSCSGVSKVRSLEGLLQQVNLFLYLTMLVMSLWSCDFEVDAPLFGESTLHIQ